MHQIRIEVFKIFKYIKANNVHRYQKKRVGESVSL